MKLAKLMGATCCVVLLHGCFNEPDRPAKDADHSKPSLQMQQPDSTQGNVAPSDQPAKPAQ